MVTQRRMDNIVIMCLQRHDVRSVSPMCIQSVSFHAVSTSFDIPFPQEALIYLKFPPQLEGAALRSQCWQCRLVLGFGLCALALNSRPRLNFRGLVFLALLGFRQPKQCFPMICNT